ncbi:MAG: metallophosphoesterase [Candidatus Glassbacteria bacterium]
MRRRQMLWSLLLLAFITACGQKPLPQPFSFIVVDDLHYARTDDYSDTSALDARTRRTIRQSENNFLPLMNELKKQAEIFQPRPVAIFSCGDIVHGGVSDPAIQFRHFLEDYNSVAMPVPLFNAMGNHEAAGEGMERAYDEAFLPFMSRETGRSLTARHFSVDFGNSHFILLDAQPPDRRGGDHDKRIFELMDKQWDWLKADLEANKNKEHIFVIAHPTIWPVSSGDVWYVYDPQKQREFVDLLLEYNVRIYFGGHEHVYSVVGYENEAGKQLLQMIPDSEIPLDETEPSPPVTSYTIQNVAAGESPWAGQLQELVRTYQDRIRYFRKTNQAAGYFMVTVEGTRVTVEMHGALSRKPIERYVVEAAGSRETKFSYSQP